MTYFDVPRRSAPRRSSGRRIERFEMRALVVLTYPLFLTVAVLRRLGVGRPPFGAVVTGSPVSVFTEARQTAEATIPSAFRGNAEGDPISRAAPSTSAIPRERPRQPQSMECG